MARHLMAVCVVCLLCADHLPCKEHILPSDNLPSLKHINAIIGSEMTEPRIPGSDITGTYMYDKRKDKTKVDDDEDIEKSLIRTRRHADHSTEHEHHPHHHEIAKVTKTYVELIFERFGNSTTNTMNLQDFDKMLHELNLTHLITNKLPEITKVMPAVTDNSQSCMSSLDFVEKMTEQKSEKLKEYKEQQHDHSDHSDHSDHEHSYHLENTLKPIDILNSTSWLADIKSSLLIEHEHFTSICPILLYHIAGRNSSEKGGCLNNAYFSGKEIYANEGPEMEDRGKVWLYSTLSLVGISLCGLLGVAVIPIMEKHFYHHVLQFLVALAVGTLCGDALLHLLPHAMMPSGNGEDIHRTMMLRGLAAVFGIVFFYFFERFLTMITEWRQKKQKRDIPSSRVRVMRDPESISLNNGNANIAGDHKQCKHKYSSYPYCYDEIASDTKDDHHEHKMHALVEHQEQWPLEDNVDTKHSHHKTWIQNCKNHGEHGDHGHDQIIIPPTDDTLNKHAVKMNGKIYEFGNNDADNNTISTSLDDGSIESNALCNNNKNNLEIVPVGDVKDKEDNYTIILREHHSTHHGHSHTHGHVHSPPRTLSAVVWMVIMGDGLHNFTDGMAIGAAFSNNIAGGLSTAVAVFCHELPHELGDFAVLLKAGMSAKQAVYYNVLSSILSFFGMVVGILIGNTPEASQWIFAVAAGLFIYIALVDMMPELTSSHSKEEGGCLLSRCFLQFLGMTTGFSTMLLIALYEDDLKKMFAS